MTNGKIPAEVSRWLDDLYALLFDPKPKGGEQEMKCPNCDGEMEFNEDTGKWECPDCGYTE